MSVTQYVNAIDQLIANAKLIPSISKNDIYTMKRLRDWLVGTEQDQLSERMANLIIEHQSTYINYLFGEEAASKAHYAVVEDKQYPHISVTTHIPKFGVLMSLGEVTSNAISHTFKADINTV